MKKLSIFLMLMAMLSPLAMNAYNHQVQVGDGTSGQNFAPINIYYNYSYTQQIYTVAQINDGCNYVGDIESISFYYASSTEKTVPITVYMKTTEKTSFSGTSDWETVSESNIVFDDDLTVSSAGWVTITLNRPFAYDGRSNLLIAVNKPDYYSNYANVNWNTTATTNSQVIYARRDSNGAYDPTNPGTATGVSTSLPNLLINMTLATPAPANVRVSDLGGDFAQISWDAPATNVTRYAYEYTDGVNIENGTTTNTYVDLSSLDFETDYIFEVKAVYSDGESCVKDVEFSTLEACPTPRNLTLDELTSNSALISWTGSGPDSFTVEVGTIADKAMETILSEGFEGGSMPDGWSKTGSYWQITSGTGNSSYTGSATGSYNAGCYIGSYSGSDILITPAMDLGAAESATLNFNFWNTSWGGDINVLNVYYRVDGGDWNLLYTDDQSNSGWTAVPTITLEGLAANYQIGFECQSNYSYGMGIDDVVVEAQLGNITWTPVSTNASNPFDFSPLTPGTTYRVRVYGVCGGTPGQPSDALTFTTPACATVPTNLTESNITINSADLSWNGTSDSYLLQYRPWLPAGEDVQPTGNVLTTTSYDLSSFTGNGSVVIRHYNCYNQFALIVDNIVVTNANGTVVFSEDFENCGGTMPSAFTNMDMDGDGHVWEIAASPQMTVDGTYGLASYSYNNDNSEVLYPNNWLIINNIPMGGEITFDYCAQDAAWAAENFCVYVSTENSIVEVPVTGTTYAVENLLPNTPYAWQVKGVCSDQESAFASSFFQTLNDEIVFQTAGNWNDAANWDVNYVPSADDKVRIEAAATIPSGVVAYAKTTSIATGGSITIEDGGQLKQGTNNIDVTVQKTITGVGEDNWNADNNRGYYFIATPVGTTLFASTAPGWGYAQNLISGDYDLYSFDPTQELEWYNYKANTSDFTKLFANQGYLYAKKETTPLNFIGTTTVKSLDKVVTEDFTYDATSTDDFNGWALVGNPFTCNAYLSYVDANGDALEANFYTMSPTNGYELASSTNGIAPCTGAMVNYSATGKIQFASEAPTGNKTGMINMTLSCANKNVDQVRVRFGQGHNLQHMSFRNNSKVYMPVDGNDCAVVYTENQGEQPVSFKAEENGTYTLSITTEDVNFGYLHLIDNMTGNDVDLLSTPSYTFEARTTDYTSRFKLVFATGNADDNFAFYSNGSFVINNEGNATLQVIDINGRILSTENINGCTNVNFNAAPGVYMLRLVNGDNVKVQKVVVR
ncbi:MAG: fibronectin type III domain-containing protein [Bacteroidales bacterium]|nr:fibronectin type III domain-containing protein [Bacteroidales bacterium]